MTSAGPWSVKGIDPKAREIAKDLARRSGMTLGEWLNQMIIDGGEPEPPPYEPRYEPRGADAFRRQGTPRSSAFAYYDEADTGDLGRVTRALDALSARLEMAEHRSTLAITGIDQSVMGVLARIDGIGRGQAPAGEPGFQGALDEVRATQSQLAERLRTMSEEEGPRVEAMKALEASLARVAAQIHEGEARARAGMAEVRQDLSGMNRRIDQIDAKVAAGTDPAQASEAIVSRIAERLEAAEARTSAAVRALESSFAGLDERLKQAEAGLDPAAEADGLEWRFERLAAELSDKVEASRAEMAERLLQAADDGKLDRMEAALRDLTAQVETAERQSAQAIDRMGQEVVRVAQTLNQRVATVESRSAAAVEQVGGEMARIADVMDSRMRSVEAAQAEALERLGGEISRIAERLSDRIALSERRAAQAIEDVGEQVVRVSDAIGQRNDKAASEISERIRQSEERTAKLLQEAQDKLDTRLRDTQRRLAVEAAVAEAAVAEAVAQVASRPDAAPAVELDDDADDAEAFGNAEFDEEPAELATAAEAAPEAAAARPTPADFSPASYTLGAGFAPAAFKEFTPTSFAAETFEEAEPERAGPEAFADTVEDEDEAGAAAEIEAQAESHVEDEAADQDDFVESSFDEPEPETAAEAFALPPVPSEPGFAQPATSTRELIEAARAAARQAATAEGRLRRGRDEVFGSAQPVEDDAGRRGQGGLAGLWPLKKKKKDHGSTVRTALLASGTAAALVATTVGSYLLYSKDSTPQVADATPRPAPAAAAAIEEKATAQILAPALTAAPDASLAPLAAPAAPTPKAAAAPAAAPAPAPARGPAADDLFADAVRQLNTGDNTGVATLRKAADQGYAPAQFYLAKLFETGAYAVKKDPAEARRWTERAAVGGDPKAMHNLALYYFDGVGGTKNAIVAASWFRKAAEGGLQDSQYNLARLYEQGYGVPQNPAEAYKWYLIAAAGGDAESKSSAERLRPRLSVDTVATAQRAAAVFHSLTTRTAAR